MHEKSVMGGLPRDLLFAAVFWRPEKVQDPQLKASQKQRATEGLNSVSYHAIIKRQERRQTVTSDNRLNTLYTRIFAARVQKRGSPKSRNEGSGILHHGGSNLLGFCSADKSLDLFRQQLLFILFSVFFFDKNNAD